MFIPSDPKASLTRLLSLGGLSPEEKVSYTRNVTHILESVPYSESLIRQVVSQYLSEETGIQSTLLKEIEPLRVFIWNSQTPLE